MTLRTKLHEAFVVAVVVTLAGVASAQAPGRAKPAPAPAAPSAAQAQGAPQATQDARNIITSLHARNVQVEEYGRLAQERGASPKVKEMGQKLQSDSQKLERQLAPVAQAHGVALADAKSITQDGGFRRAMDMLRKLNGADFDRTFAEATAKAREDEVAQLKQMRDRTPGSDSQLKKYLDDHENVMEEHRNLARDLRTETQRQGRAPPK